MKTSELTGTALAWAVGMAEGFELSLYGVDPSIRARVPGLGVHAPWNPAMYYSQGGPIMDRAGISVVKCNPLYFPKGNENGDYYEDYWKATLPLMDLEEGYTFYGKTYLIAAMRCYVASKLGDDVEIPKGLLP